MNPNRVPMMAGNWKLNLGIHATGGLVRALVAGLKELHTDRDTEVTTQVVVAPVFTSLSVAHQAAWGSPVQVAAQNCHWENSGAFTGEIAAPMLTEIGIHHVILGHSERRQYFGETDDSVNHRLKAALGAGLVPIVCIGERLEEREGEHTEAVLERQLAGALAGLDGAALDTLIVAYEPVWAIGTGRVASTDQAQAAHAFIRNWLADQRGAEVAGRTRILYGGSAKPGNVGELLDCADVDGALVGGASLDEAQFLPMIAAAEERAQAGSPDP